jgi:regulator of sirC expression with transglutaminase-like and TPR domain
MSARKKSTAPMDALRDMLANPNAAIDLAEAALLLAACDAPAADLSDYRAHMKSLFEAIDDEALRRDLDARTAAPDELAGVLSAVIAGAFQYRGDEETYDDLDNANLMRVIDRRKGLPVVLGILYIAAAKRQGWNVAGLSFPGHFLVRLESEDGSRAIIDPFHDGQIMDTHALRDLLKVVAGPAEELDASHYAAVSDREILLRLQNNVKTRRLDLGQMDSALAALETMQVLSPDNPALYREAGLLNLRLGQLSDALRSLESYLDHAPLGPERSRIDTVVKDLKQRIN